MWGQIVTEASYQYNFNTGFPSTRSDVLVHLAQWQYWWWFWFTFLWSFYYLVITRIVRYRTLKMHPKIVTSYRPHGKWGDFLACTIPAVWCINILTNSNFILRLTEWQHESSLFNVRIHGRQWYWVYKMDLKNFIDIVSAPKNIGSNKWVSNNFGDLQTSNDYLHILRLRYDNRWLKTYWEAKLKEVEKENNFYTNLPLKNKSFTKYNNAFNNVNKLSNQNLINLGGNSKFFKEYQQIMYPNKFKNKLTNLYKTSVYDYTKGLQKQLKKKIEEGVVKNKFISQPLGKLLVKPNYSFNLDTVFSQYKLSQRLFKKNLKTVFTIIDNLNSKTNLWGFVNKNSVIRVYPNTARTTLSSTLLDISNEGTEDSKTNAIVSSNFNWDASDRFFLNFSRKNNVDITIVNNILTNKKLSNGLIVYKHSDHSDMNRWLKRGSGTKDPLRVIKYPNLGWITEQEQNVYKEEVALLRFRFNEDNQHVVGKAPNNTYFAFKQKRYNVRKKFTAKKRFVKGLDNSITTKSVSPEKIRLRVLVKNNFFKTISDQAATVNYKFLKKDKKHSELIPVPLARRLLRTRRTLVVPAHINISVITNSYDVVHAWFVPSLGVKLDCVPGRSTHHVMYIDSTGFYYGQCAEICGRYHHHMPIRICALPFEHFLLWWHSYGSPKLLFTKSSRKVNAYYSNSKYVW